MVTFIVIGLLVAGVVLSIVFPAKALEVAKWVYYTAMLLAAIGKACICIALLVSLFFMLVGGFFVATALFMGVAFLVMPLSVVFVVPFSGGLILWAVTRRRAPFNAVCRLFDGYGKVMFSAMRGLITVLEAMLDASFSSLDKLCDHCMGSIEKHANPFVGPANKARTKLFPNN